MSPDVLDADAPGLLALYTDAAQAWIEAGDALHAAEFLAQAIPLAAYQADVDVFVLLDIALHAEADEASAFEVWDSALVWLEAAAGYLAQ